MAKGRQKRQADDAQRIAPPSHAELPAAKSFQIDCSAFRPDSAEAMISSMLRGNDRVGALRQFLEEDRQLRIVKAKDAAERGDWGDAGNVYNLPNTEADILSGRDVEVLERKLKDVRAGGYSNKKHYEALAKLYLAARKRVFPEAK
jgi:hypothetical protein